MVIVTREGRVWHKKLKRYLSISQTKGYNQVHFGGKCWRVCRLVARAYIPNPHNLPTVNHIDEVKHNDNVANLEWMTVGDNNRYSKCKTVDFRHPDGHKITVTNLSAYARDNNLHGPNLTKVASGLRIQHKGYTLWTIVPLVKQQQHQKT